MPGLEQLDDPNVATLARAAWELRRLKVHDVEPGFRRWTIRSLKPQKKERRHATTRPIEPDESAIVPLLLYQRLIVARADDGEHSHVEAAETNIASSFAAALTGAMIEEPPKSNITARYRERLSELLSEMKGAHPKVNHTANEAMSAAQEWEKTLVFCERNATIGELKETLDAQWLGRLLKQWQRIVPDATHEAIFGASEGSSSDGMARKVGAFQRWAARFTRGQDELSVALREAYPHTLFVPPDANDLPRALFRAESSLLADANDVLAAQVASGTSVSRLEYRIARRCVDVAVARWFERHEPGRFADYGGIARNLLDLRYPALGIDLVEDEEERDMMGTERRPIEWRISPDTLQALLHPRRRSIWFPFRAQLAEFEPTERGNIVEAVRIFLTRRQVPFIVEVLDRVKGDRNASTDFRDTLEAWWPTSSCPWRARVAEFLAYIPRLGARERADVLAQALKAGTFVAASTDGDQRGRIQDAFNTPFFPMILVGNKTIQEGLNLHRQCRRVVHHDLRWNPADIEQRVGRVDRHGSLAERRLAETGGAQGHILIETPLLGRTIDHVRYRRVKEREKWLEFLLGAPPDIRHGHLDAREIQPLPTVLTDDLRVRLEPVEG